MLPRGASKLKAILLQSPRSGTGLTLFLCEGVGPVPSTARSRRRHRSLARSATGSVCSRRDTAFPCQTAHGSHTVPAMTGTAIARTVVDRLSPIDSDRCHAAHVGSKLAAG